MSLFKLYNEGKISQDVAVDYSSNKPEIERMLKGIFHGTGA